MAGAGSAGGDDLDPLELLELGVAGGRHRVAQCADEVRRAVRGDRGSEEDLLERPGGAHLDAVAAGEGRVVRLAAPVVAAARRLLSAGERRTDHETDRKSTR